MDVQSVKRGAIPSSRRDLAVAIPYAPLIGAPPNFIVIPAKLSMWGNDVHGTCVTAEESFAKACHSPEVFIPEGEVINWATKHGVLEGASITQVMQWMQTDGFPESPNIYDDGPFSSVDWANPSTLQSAICKGPVKIGVAADQIETAWHSTNGHSGWFGTGFHNDAGEDHCVALCGYGTLAWLAGQLNVSVPAGVDGSKPGYAMFTWNSIGIIDHPSMLAVTHEAWLRQPTTVIKTSFPNWQMLDNNPATAALAADQAALYQLHNSGLIWKYTGTPLTGWQELDNNPASVKIAAAGGNLYQLHKTGKIWRYTGTPLTGWQLLDQNPATVDIVASGPNLFQLHNNGKIWKYTGTPLTGWLMLDNNPATKKVIASGGNLYQLHDTGKIWRYTGPPLSGWQQVDNNPATIDIVADGNDLYQLHKTGLIWKYTGTPMTGWQMLDNNPAGQQIAAANGRLFQRHSTGAVWKYVGPPITGWQELDNNGATVSIVASGPNLYQRHGTGKIWRYTGA